MQTYLFYDIETTGLSKPFDQILQFAAIRTDLNLNEIESYELKIRLNPDIIPSPSAIITHRIGVKECMEGISEIDAIKQIHHWLNVPGTISLGYNSISFDDEFLRFSFHRNLLTPYTHQFANQCSRMDLYPITVMYYLYRNHVIKWPERNNKISLKLEELNKMNELAEGRSHHAMVDVEATLALARHFLNERDMWDFLTGYFNKQIDQSRLQNLQNNAGLMVDGFFGADNYFQSPVLSLGSHYHYTNQTLWLQLDTENLSDVAPAELKVSRKKLGEPRFIIPLKDRFLQHLKPERLSLVEANTKWLQENPDKFNKIIDYHLNFKYPAFPEADVETRLYLDGFLSAEEERFCKHFHAVNPDEKAKSTERLKNPKLRQRAIRLLGRHYPEALLPQQKEVFAEYVRSIETTNEAETLIDYAGRKRLTRKMALNEIVELRKREDLVPEQIKLLDELEGYLDV